MLLCLSVLNPDRTLALGVLIAGEELISLGMLFVQYIQSDIHSTFV